MHQEDENCDVILRSKREALEYLKLAYELAENAKDRFEIASSAARTRSELAESYNRTLRSTKTSPQTECVNREIIPAEIRSYFHIL